MTVVRRCRPLLGTFVAVEAEESGRSARALHALVDAALGAVARVQALLSFHDPASELARLNRAAHVAPVAVDPWTREVLAEALRIARASGGAFDPSVGPALVRLGFLPRPVGAARAAARGSWRDVELLADGRVRLRARSSSTSGASPRATPPTAPRRSSQPRVWGARASTRGETCASRAPRPAASMCGTPARRGTAALRFP